MHNSSRTKAVTNNSHKITISSSISVKNSTSIDLQNYWINIANARSIIRLICSRMPLSFRNSCLGSILLRPSCPRLIAPVKLYSKISRFLRSLCIQCWSRILNARISNLCASPSKIKGKKCQNSQTVKTWVQVQQIKAKHPTFFQDSPKWSQD